VEELTILCHKLSGSAPECRDSIPELVHANDKAVNFLVLPHEGEWVTVNDLLAGLFNSVEFII